MKTKWLILIVLSLISLVTIQAMTNMHHDIPEHIEISDIPPDMTEIVLQGTLDCGGNPNSVEAYFNSNMVVVCFHQNFGCVNIILIGGGNTIYNGNVNTAVQQTVYIPIAGAPSGSYTLILDNTNGGCEGNFEK
jgi:hypothetical protein